MQKLDKPASIEYMYKKYASTLYTILGIILVAAIFFVIYHPPTFTKSIKPTSTLDLNPIPSTIASEISAEPTIGAWKTYTNDQFGFTINVPDGWYLQQYTSISNKGETLIAFSPNPLPCQTCTYIHDGYFSIRIYNQTTSPIYYEDFQQRIKSAGRQKDYIPVSIDKKPGVLYANTVAFEYQGWVYEFSLDTDDGKANINNSQLAQKILTSMNFNNVIFNK